MAIDRKKAIEDLAKIKVKGNEDGLIPAFGFWFNFTYKFLEHLYRKIAQSSGFRRSMVERELENAAAECGYHTGWGIIILKNSRQSLAR